MSTQIKRVYENPSPVDGYRVLVDNLWPRGLTKEKASVDEWLRDLAPSTALRRWYGHESARWDEFKRRYFAELESEPAAEAVKHLRKLAKRRRVTLLYGSREEKLNNAAALQEYLKASSRKLQG